MNNEFFQDMPTDSEEFKMIVSEINDMVSNGQVTELKMRSYLSANALHNDAKFTCGRFKVTISLNPINIFESPLHSA